MLMLLLLLLLICVVVYVRIVLQMRVGRRMRLLHEAHRVRVSTNCASGGGVI